MTGLDKIIAEITAEAQREADAVLARAREEAARVEAEAKAESDAALQKVKNQQVADVNDIARAGESARALQRRQRILAEKQRLLDETLAAAQAELRALPDADYFSLLVRLAAASAEKGKGEMLLGSADLARLPADFGAKLAAALPAGAELAVSKTPRPLDGGFVLKYGDIELNNSFAAIFDARREEFTDTIQGILFA